MLPPLVARPPTDTAEERRIPRLAAARHAPASWLERARIITLSWDGGQVGQIAARLGCHPRTVSRWLHRCNAGGLDDLGDLPRPGRPPAAVGAGRGRGIALVASDPPGRLVRQPDGRPRVSGSAAARPAAAWSPRGCAGGRCAVHPKGACWLNLQQAWWRQLRRAALAGQTFACPDEITLATPAATSQLNARARPWAWGRPPPPPRYPRPILTHRTQGTQH